MVSFHITLIKSFQLYTGRHLETSHKYMIQMNSKTKIKTDGTIEGYKA